jgi:hypothetical protein
VRTPPVRLGCREHSAWMLTRACWTYRSRLATRTRGRRSSTTEDDTTWTGARPTRWRGSSSSDPRPKGGIETVFRELTEPNAKEAVPAVVRPSRRRSHEARRPADPAPIRALTLQVGSQYRFGFFRSSGSAVPTEKGSVRPILQLPAARCLACAWAETSRTPVVHHVVVEQPRRRHRPGASRRETGGCAIAGSSTTTNGFCFRVAALNLRRLLATGPTTTGLGC